jgi:hypothetical protein
MTTLTDIRGRVRKDLHDTDSSNYRWTDAQLDRHIARALSDVSLAIPRERTADIGTTSGDRDISVTSLAELLAIEAIEYPVDEFPPAYIGFSQWDETVTLHLDGAPDGSNARLYYTASHTLDGTTSTVPAQYEDVLATGASAFAALEYSAYAADLLNTGGDEVGKDYGAWGRAWMTAFRELLRRHGRDRRVRAKRLFTPA